MNKIVHQTLPYFFRTGPAPFARLGVFVALSFLLMVLDARFHYMGVVRESLGTVMLTIQHVAAYSTRWAHTIEENIADRTQLNEEIEKLRLEQYKNAGVYTQNEYLTNENNRLRRLLDLKTRLVEDTAAAEVLFELKSPAQRKVAVNKGSVNGVRAGQAVVTAGGLFGQVTQTYPFMSEVTLVSDARSAVPVKVMRNALKTVAYGLTAGDSLELKYVELNADIQPGDLLITSGIDGTYLPGIPVATVTSVDRRPVTAFAKIICKPLSSLQEQMHVLILTQNNHYKYPENPFLADSKLTPDPLPPLTNPNGPEFATAESASKAGISPSQRPLPTNSQLPAPVAPQLTLPNTSQPITPNAVQPAYPTTMPPVTPNAAKTNTPAEKPSARKDAEQPTTDASANTIQTIQPASPLPLQQSTLNPLQGTPSNALPSALLLNSAKPSSSNTSNSLNNRSNRPATRTTSPAKPIVTPPLSPNASQAQTRFTPQPVPQAQKPAQSASAMPSAEAQAPESAVSRP